jgi:hypothetical protein
LTETNIQGKIHTMSYRLHIDIPIEACSVEEAQEKARQILSELCVREGMELSHLTEEVNYRLGHDDDRQRSNYLEIDSRGHCSSKKTKVKCN